MKKKLQNHRDKIAVAGVTALGLGAVVRSARLRNRYKKFAKELDKLLTKMLNKTTTTRRVGYRYFISRRDFEATDGVHEVEIDLRGKLFETKNKKLVLIRGEEELFKNSTCDTERFRDEIAKHLYKTEPTVAERLLADNDDDAVAERLVADDDDDDDDDDY